MGTKRPDVDRPWESAHEFDAPRATAAVRGSVSVSEDVAGRRFRFLMVTFSLLVGKQD